jgi:hypothetical protein
MIMLGSKLVTHVLCQVVHYPPLQEDDELKVRKCSSTIEDVLHLLMEDVMDYVSFCDEDIDHIAKLIID